jgi:hypothetical protein
VTSHTTELFRKLLEQLPKAIQKQAKEAYVQFEKDPYHKGLHFKRVHSKLPIYSVLISRDYRALGIQRNGVVIWFWIGSHSDYDKMLKKMKNAT